MRICRTICKRREKGLSDGNVRRLFLLGVVKGGFCVAKKMCVEILAFFDGICYNITKEVLCADGAGRFGRKICLLST